MIFIELLHERDLEKSFFTAKFWIKFNSAKYPLQTAGPMSQHGQFAHPHHPHSHPAVLHNASLADITSQGAASHPHHHLAGGTAASYSSNLGSAVATSMHLTNSTSETDAGNSTYKMEHDLYYSVSDISCALLFSLSKVFLGSVN